MLTKRLASDNVAQDGQTKHSLVGILIMLSSDVPTGRSLLGVFGFGNLMLVGSVCFVERLNQMMSTRDWTKVVKRQERRDVVVCFKSRYAPSLYSHKSKRSWAPTDRPTDLTATAHPD